MLSSKHKWNGTKITLNYIGNLDNKFGIKKKKIFLEEDKLESLIDYRNLYLFSTRLKKNKNHYNYFKNNFWKNKEKEIASFKSLNIKDWEKTNNYNFYNYFSNLKYMKRINNSKRLLSSKTNNTTKFRINKNKSSIHIFKSDNKSKVNNKRKSNNEIYINNKEYYGYSEKEDAKVKEKDKEKIKEKKRIANKFNKFNTNYKKERISKRNISELITNFITQKNSEILEFNLKNKKINDYMRTKSLILKLESHNSLKSNSNSNYINKIKAKINFNSASINNINDISKYNNNNNNQSPLFLYSKNKDDNKNLYNNNNMKVNQFLYSYYPKNYNYNIIEKKDKRKIIQYNNSAKIRNINNFRSKKKVSTFCDAATNTDF